MPSRAFAGAAAAFPRRHALLALAALPLGPARAASPEAARLRQAAGGTLAQLAALPAVAGPLRGAARGRQQKVYDGLHAPGPPVALWEGRWLVGWSCADPAPEAGCRERGLFLAIDAETERLFLMLLVDGVPDFLAPARTGRWPAALAAPFAEFAAELAHPPTFDEP